MTRRTKLTVEVVVETNGSLEDHNKAVNWASAQALRAHQFAHSREYIAVRVHDGKNFRGMSAYGAPQGDTNEIVEDIFDMSEETA